MKVRRNKKTMLPVTSSMERTKPVFHSGPFSVSASGSYGYTNASTRYNVTNRTGIGPEHTSVDTGRLGRSMLLPNSSADIAGHENLHAAVNAAHQYDVDMTRYRMQRNGNPAFDSVPTLNSTQFGGGAMP
jgi:hypothetical protein